MRDYPDGCFILSDVDETLLRQVHPAMCPNGKPSSSAFYPSPKDDDLLSTLRGHVDPAEAFRRWVYEVGSESVGTYGIEVGCASENDLTAIDDSAHGPLDHASVDFGSLPSRGARVRAGRILRDAAVSRGCLYSPE